MLLFFLTACGSLFEASPPPLPQGLPPDIRQLTMDAQGAVRLDGEVVLAADRLNADPLSGSQVPLIEALDATSSPVWVQAPPEAPWYAVRKLVLSAKEADVSELWVGDSTHAYGPPVPPPLKWRDACPDGPVEVSSLTRMLNLEVQHGGDGTWVKAAVTFFPAGPDTTYLQLPSACWDTPGCAALASEPSACEAALGVEGIPNRVPVAGPVGCLLPIRKQPGDEALWPAELGRVLGDLGFTDADPATLLIDAEVEWSSVLAIFEAFAQADLGTPALGSPMPQGGGHPPLCTIRTRTKAQVDQAGARWFGSQLSDRDLPPKGVESNPPTPEK